MNQKKQNFYFNQQTYSVEAVLSEWLAVVFPLMTSSLLFYHMTRVKSLEMDKRLAALFAISLIMVCILYNVSSIFPYSERMNYIISEARRENDNQNVNKLTLLKYTFVALGMVTIIIQLGICGVIIKNTIDD